MGKLVVLMITAFVDMVGLLMVLPLLPFYAKDLGGSGLVVGVLVSSFAVAQLLASPFWGRFSDRYGRRPALLIGLTASAIAYVVFAYASSLWLLFVSRIVQGAGGGTVSVIQAYVADSVAAEDRAKGLGWLSAATNAGEPPSRLILIYAIAIGAFQGVGAILALFLAARFGVTEKTIGFFFMYIGVIAVLTRAVILGRAVDYFGEVRLSRIGLVLLTLGLASMPFMDRVATPLAFASGGGAGAMLPYLPLALAVTLLPLGTAFTFPCVTALLSRVIPSHERGLYMGVQQTFGGMARVVFPILAGYAFDRVVELPFLVSAGLVAGALFLGVGMEDVVRAKPAAASSV